MNKYLEQIKGIIFQEIGRKPIQVILYGSRASGNNHQTSDVDIALLSANRIDQGFISHLKEKLEESNVPYKIEIVDLNNVSSVFRKEVITKGVIWKQTG